MAVTEYGDINNVVKQDKKKKKKKNGYDPETLKARLMKGGY